MKPLVIYHANCADGFGAAFAAWLKLGDGADYVPLGYDAGIGVGELAAQFNTFRLVDAKGNFHVISTPQEERDVYILDFSFKKPIMDFIFAHAKRVVWLDHHKTAFEMWGVDPTIERVETARQPHWIQLAPNKSGAYLAWEYFHPGTEVPMLIKHIEDYDLWKFRMEGTKAINKALWSYAPWSFDQWNWWLDSEDELIQLEAEGEAILRAHDQNVQSVVKGGARACDISILGTNNEFLSNVIGLAANCPPFLTSDVGHELANQSGTFGLCWCIGDDAMAKCSLRSNGDYDVSAIARSFGGGGHRNAAGFSVDIQTLLGWMK